MLARRYDFDSVHHVAKHWGANLDAFLYGSDALGLLLWWGDLGGMRAGVTKVLDAHRRLLARVRQGEATADGCVLPRSQRMAARS